LKFDVTLDKRGIDRLMANVSGMQKNVEEAVKKTAVQTHRMVIDEIRASKKRSGTNELAKSYIPKKIGAMAWEIASQLKRAIVHEIGRKGGGRIIKPKTAKMLTIPIRDDVLTPSGAQISQGAKNRLFAMLKKRKGRSLHDIFNEAGIVLAKSAKMSNIKGKFILRDKIRPKAAALLKQNFDDMIRRVLNG
jgi:hypothetical protein